LGQQIQVIHFAHLALEHLMVLEFLVVHWVQVVLQYQDHQLIQKVQLDQAILVYLLILELLVALSLQ
jgi:hypothetical protein